MTLDNRRKKIAMCFWLATALIATAYRSVFNVVDADTVHAISWVFGVVHGYCGYYLLFCHCNTKSRGDG